MGRLSADLYSTLSSRMDELMVTSPLIRSSTTMSSPGSILNLTTYCCPCAMRESTSSLSIVSEFRICMRVEASYWKLAISFRLASNSAGVSNAM